MAVWSSHCENVLQTYDAPGTMLWACTHVAPISAQQAVKPEDVSSGSPSPLPARRSCTPEGARAASLCLPCPIPGGGGGRKLAGGLAWVNPLAAVGP